MAHTVNCNADWCPEFSTVVGFASASPAEEAAAHRRSLAEEGWTDLEGRDYCPDHRPEAAS